jgi:LuxR family transcriptional regulator
LAIVRNFRHEVEKVADDVDKAEQVETILKRLTDENPTGFAIGLHVSFTTSKFLFQSYRKDWMEEYSRRGLIMHDPTVRWGLTNDGAIRWSGLLDIDEADVFGTAKKYGLVYGVTIAMVRDETRSIGSFARSDREFTDVEIDGFSSAIQRMHDLTKDEEMDSADETRLRRLAISSTHG